jgi:hypothetical protein
VLPFCAPRQIAIAAFRRSEDFFAVVCTSDGPEGDALAELDARSPVAGLYVRAEWLLAQQVLEQYDAAACL